LPFSSLPRARTRKSRGRP